MSDNQNHSAGSARKEGRPAAKAVSAGKMEQPGGKRLTDHREALREALDRGKPSKS